MRTGPLYFRLSAVVLGTIFVFGVVVVVLHALALGHATATVRRDNMRLMADETARDLGMGLARRLPAPYQFVVTDAAGRVARGELPPPWLHVPKDAPDTEACARWGGPCYAVRALPEGARLVVYHRPGLLIAPLTLALVSSVIAWIGLSAGAGFLLLRAMRRADEGRRRLLAGLAHDLGTPLTSIRGFAETLLASSEQGDDRRGWTVVYREALRMQRLVEDMLALSRIEAGRLQLVLRPFDLREIVEAAAERAALAFGTPPAIRLPDAPALVNADRDRLDQALANLVDNAYRHGGGAAVRLSLAPRSGGYRLEVEDDGPGVTPEARGRLFVPFVGGDAGRSSGLGLTIAREIALRHRGQLVVGAGPGCRVTLDIPA
jgi:signal transduction histidine kinase